jgi:hypothetical protein
MSKSTWPRARARGAFQIYAYTAQVDVLTYARPSPFVEAATR